MISRSKVPLFLLLFFFTGCLTSNAQEHLDTGFVHHLGRLNLQTEHGLYLQRHFADNEKAQAYRAAYHLQYFNDSLFLTAFAQTKPAYRTGCLYQRANALFLHPSAGAQNWFARAPDDANIAASPAYTVFRASVNPLFYQAGDFDETLQADFTRYQRIYRKKAWVAGLASAVLPGLGKLYIGRKNSFFNGLMVSGLYAVQLTESISKGGINHPLSIVNLALGGFFYLSNIAGTIHDVKVRKRELRDEFLINASRYYETLCDCNLY